MKKNPKEKEFNEKNKQNNNFIKINKEKKEGEKPIYHKLKNSNTNQTQ